MIDWQKQWELFSSNYKDGFAHVDLSHYGVFETIKLCPGAGFGDHSHPTTRLMLQMIKPYIYQKNTLDIGCGSGILTIASLKMGAAKAYGVDLTKETLDHAIQNAKINSVLDQAHFFLPSSIPSLSCSTILMNMIFAEQKMAFQQYQDAFKQATHLLTSGVLSSQVAEYESFLEMNHWKKVDCFEEQEWVGYVWIKAS